MWRSSVRSTKGSRSVQVVVADCREKPELEAATADTLVRLDGILDGGDFPVSPPMPHTSSIGLGQLVSSGASLSNVFAGSDQSCPRSAKGSTFVQVVAADRKKKSVLADSARSERTIEPHESEAIAATALGDVASVRL